ncbi:HEAT repeat domain-containing protein [Gryllotalpicola reticulitermitis]|uniref:HEAT repeat domain-containing protein n=1 Tax=Gryllotalpicola reticulitermitis TaxID=1184153 RepID=A0ABV8Q636_9MICO
MAFYCWACYGRNDHTTGACVHCGHEISPPAEATETQRLIWALRHPDPDVAIISARRLGAEGNAEAVSALREAIDRPPDPYVAGEALHSLLALSTVDNEKQLLERLAAGGPFMLRRQAERALAAAPASSPVADDGEAREAGISGVAGDSGVGV